MNPWNNIENAFDPMFETPISFNGKDGKRTLLYCCIMTDNTMDADVDGFIDTDVEQLNIVIKPCDYCFVNENVKRGDTITTERGIKYTVQKVIEDFALGLIVKVRN